MFFDAHTHVQFATFRKDWQEVIQRALSLGIWMINIGTQKDTSRRAVEIANSHPEGVYATVGLHPIHTEISFQNAKEMDPIAGPENGTGTVPPVSGFWSRGEVFDYDYYRNLAGDPKVLAIGECGLDYYRITDETQKIQKAAFELQIQLAREVKKPLMIHCRSAYGDLIRMLADASNLLLAHSPGLVHLFTGSRDDARKLLDLGFSFSFGGLITVEREYDEIIRMIPLDRLFSETDAPFMTPDAYRGRRNEPAFVVEVVRRLAAIRGLPTEAIQEAIWENAKRFFSLPVSSAN